MLASPLGTTHPRMQQHYDSGARQINIVIGQHNYAKKCDLIAFLNTAFYSYNENVFCGNRCYLFCTSILHDIKVKRGQKKKKGKKLKRQKRSGKKNKNSRYVSFIFLETNLCMPIRVEHFDSFTHVQMFVVFRSNRVESWSAGQK